MIRTVCDQDSKEVSYPWVVVEYRPLGADSTERAKRLDFCNELCASHYFGNKWREKVMESEMAEGMV